jgi:hypothetical protein
VKKQRTLKMTISMVISYNFISLQHQYNRLYSTVINLYVWIWYKFCCCCCCRCYCCWFCCSKCLRLIELFVAVIDIRLCAIDSESDVLNSTKSVWTLKRCATKLFQCQFCLTSKIYPLQQRVLLLSSAPKLNLYLSLSLSLSL